MAHRLPAKLAARKSLCVEGHKHGQTQGLTLHLPPHNCQPCPDLTSALVGVGVRSGAAAGGRGSAGSGVFSRGLEPTHCSMEALSSIITGEKGDTAVLEWHFPTPSHITQKPAATPDLQGSRWGIDTYHSLIRCPEHSSAHTFKLRQIGTPSPLAPAQDREQHGPTSQLRHIQHSSSTSHRRGLLSLPMAHFQACVTYYHRH